MTEFMNSEPQIWGVFTIYYLCLLCSCLHLEKQCFKQKAENNVKLFITKQYWHWISRQKANTLFTVHDYWSQYNIYMKNPGNWDKILHLGIEVTMFLPRRNTSDNNWLFHMIEKNTIILARSWETCFFDNIVHFNL